MTNISTNMNTYHEHVLGRFDALNEPLVLAAEVCLDALGAGERYEDLGGGGAQS